MNIRSVIKNQLQLTVRFFKALQRPTRNTNTRLLQKRGESVSSFIIRDAVAEDIPALAALHVKTWADTYPGVKKPPGFEIREWQWKEQFASDDKNWFCLVMENSKGELVGFTKGKPYSHTDLPLFSGELNKIYLLFDHHRLGLGRKLFCKTVERFLNQGISSMVLFSEASNPTGYFYEAMGGEKLYAKNGEFHGGYGWKDLNTISMTCTG